MGLIVDSSVLIAAERRNEPVSQLLEKLSLRYAKSEIVISTITVMELEHGWHRAPPQYRRTGDGDIWTTSGF